MVFRCTPPGGGTATELEPVQLLPPSRDDRDVANKKLEGGKRGRVDGYPVPVRRSMLGRAWRAARGCDYALAGCMP